MSTGTIPIVESFNPDITFSILAPHVDDEAIGCYTLFLLGRIKKVVYLRDEELTDCRKNEAKNFCSLFDVEFSFLAPNLIANALNTAKSTVWLLPSPNDRHGSHKFAFWVGAKLLTQYAIYSVDMSDWFVKELPQDLRTKKQEILINTYVSQSELFKCDQKYSIFEGQAITL